MARHRILERLGREAAARTDDAIASTVARARQATRDINNGGRLTCSCGDRDCPKTFRSLREQKAHAARVCMAQAGRWVSAKARAAEKRMGKALSDSRRHALSWLEAAGLKEWRKVPITGKDGKPRTRADGKPMTREIPVDTDRARSRPELRGRVTIPQLREAHRHDRTHEKADRLERKAATRDARGQRAHALLHRQEAQSLRDRWPAPARRAPADSNGTRPAPERTTRTR